MAFKSGAQTCKVGRGWQYTGMYTVWILSKQVSTSATTTLCSSKYRLGQARIQEGLSLLHNRTAQRMLITGVGQSVSKKALIRQLNLSASQLAIFHCCVDIEKTAMDTKGNAYAARMWAEANKFSTIRLVTANYHLARASLELKRLMPGHTIRSWPVIPPDLQLNGWYLHWPTVRLLAKEYAKYLLARVWL